MEHMFALEENAYLCRMKQRIYIDTSIVGGFFDIEFEAETKALF
jgi:hypothetical protein